MLVLTRKTGERIWIGDDICVTVVKLAQGGVRLGIDAPPHLAVIREELRNELKISREPTARSQNTIRANKQQDPA